MNDDELLVTLKMLGIDYWACYPLDTIFLYLKKTELNTEMKKLLTDNNFIWTSNYDEEYMVDNYIITMKGNANE